MKRLFVSLLAAVSILTPSVVRAENTAKDHHALWKELQNQGVTTIYNHKLHCPKDQSLDGRYYIHAAMLVVCQDNMTSHLKEEKWTENDYDTLRHEAHHVLQDCVTGRLADGHIGLFFTGDDHYSFVAKSSISEEELMGLYRNLEKSGLDTEQIKQEIEAYIVARDIPAEMIDSKLKQLCL